MTGTHDDLIRDWRDTLEAISDDLNVDAVMSIADTIQKTADALAADQTALRAAEAEREMAHQRAAENLRIVAQEKRRAEAAEARIAELEEENHALAAFQCPSGYGDEGGSARCTVEDRLTAAEAEVSRLRALLAGAVSREAVVDRCVTWERRALERAELYPDDETHEATASTAGSLAAEFRALPALAQPEGDDNG